MIIDNTYFDNNILNLGNFETSNSRSNDVMENKIKAIDFSISVYEQKYLCELMGVELYSEYEASKSEEKWQPLIEKLRNEETKRSPIANYVYFYHKRDNEIASSDNVDYKPVVDNSTVISVDKRRALAWNDMVFLNSILMKWIYDNIVNTETPVIETTALWDVAGWERLLKEQVAL